jgi:hypothetical protein
MLILRLNKKLPTLVIMRTQGFYIAHGIGYICGVDSRIGFASYDRSGSVGEVGPIA